MLMRVIRCAGTCHATRNTSNRGAALLGAIMAITVVIALGMTAITFTTLDSQITANQRSATQAVYTAEAGANHLIALYQGDPGLFTGTTSASDMGLPTAKPGAGNLGAQFAYWISALNYEASAPPQYVDIQSRGTVVGTNSQATVTVRLAYDPGGGLDFGIVAVDKILISGGRLDSYRACDGAYDPVNNSGPVEVITNATADNSIDMSGDALIHGDAIVGPGGDPEDAINANLSAITGSRLAATHPQADTPVPDPGGGTLHTPTFPGDIEALASGTYRIAGDLTVPGGKELHISGDVTLIVEGKLTTSGSGKIITQMGASLTAYTAGEVTVSGDSMVNLNYNPQNVMLYSTGAAKVTVSGSGAFYGRIYAPQSEVTISGDGDIYGGLFGYRITNSGGAGVHADKCGSGGGGGGAPFRVVYWQQG